MRARHTDPCRPHCNRARLLRSVLCIACAFYHISFQPKIHSFPNLKSTWNRFQKRSSTVSHFSACFFRVKNCHFSACFFRVKNCHFSACFFRVKNCHFSTVFQSEKLPFFGVFFQGKKLPFFGVFFQSKKPHWHWICIRESLLCKIVHRVTGRKSLQTKTAHSHACELHLDLRAVPSRANWVVSINFANAHSAPCSHFEAELGYLHNPFQRLAEWITSHGVDGENFFRIFFFSFLALPLLRPRSRPIPRRKTSIHNVLMKISSVFDEMYGDFFTEKSSLVDNAQEKVATDAF